MAAVAATGDVPAAMPGVGVIAAAGVEEAGVVAVDAAAAAVPALAPVVVDVLAVVGVVGALSVSVGSE